MLWLIKGWLTKKPPTVVVPLDSVRNPTRCAVCHRVVPSEWSQPDVLVVHAGLLTVDGRDFCVCNECGPVPTLDEQEKERRVKRCTDAVRRNVVYARN